MRRLKSSMSSNTTARPRCRSRCGEAAEGFDDHAFALELLETEHVLIVPGTSFNVPYRNHFRVTLLPQPEVVREVFARIERVLERRAQARTRVVPLKKKARPAA